ncbi:MAG TPA: hypothetical protein VHH90_01000 [Polyangia bacterium]|nr:hypothetical protein [Polyangia bacterium]
MRDRAGPIRRLTARAVRLLPGWLALPAIAAAAPAAMPPPVIDPASVVLYVDEGRLEVEGDGLRNMRIRWQTSTGAGTDACLIPKASGKRERCAFTVPRDLAADARLGWAPGATAEAAANTAAATPAAADGFMPLRPARVVIDRVLATATTALDLTDGHGRLPLAHPDAIAAADCAQARCELSDGAIEVGALSGAAQSVTVHAHLAPHYFVQRGDAFESTFTQVVSVLHCPASIVSGAPLRRAEATSVVVRLDGRCGGEARALRWSANGDPAQVVRVAKDGDAVLALLSVGDIEDAALTVTASRPEPDGSVIAVAHAATRPAPLPRATLELAGYGAIDFVPTNRDALVHIAPAGAQGRLVLLPSEGAYRVTTDVGGTHIRGEEGVGGYVALRFGYRVEGLPAPFAEADLAVLGESLQRPIRSASVPAPIGSSALESSPLVELVCTDDHGNADRIKPGKRTSIPFSRRDGCRVVIHRERFKPEDGTQDLTLDIDVTKVDDSPRSDGHVNERMVLRPASEPRIVWIRGVKAQFDRVSIRIAHVADDVRYVGSTETRTSLPAVQWTLVVGEGRLRFYATAAIPTGLFHITAPSGILTLNFGALSRLTWLDREGHEGLFGLELGAMGVGLAATPGFTAFPPTLAVIAGVGVSIPIGNRGEPTQASVNLHAWGAYELRDNYDYTPVGGTTYSPSHWSLLFGPSITIGNIGTNL